MSKLMDAAVRVAVDGARMNFRIDPWCQLVPIAIGIAQSKDPVIIGLRFESPEATEASVRIARREFRDRQVVAYALVAEAWVSPTLTREVNERGTMDRTPSQMPDREERVVVSATDKTSVRQVELRIVRDASNAVKELVQVYDRTASRDDSAGISFELL